MFLVLSGCTSVNSDLITQEVLQSIILVAGAALLLFSQWNINVKKSSSDSSNLGNF